MTNTARQPLYMEDVEIETTPVKQGVKQKTRKTSRMLSGEDQQIMMALNTVRRDLECLHNRYDQTTDPLLVDSIIYELKAANIKYMYYLHLCKEKGIVSDTHVHGEGRR